MATKRAGSAKNGSRRKLQLKGRLNRSKHSQSKSRQKLPNAWHLFKSSIDLLRQLWQQVLGLMVIHGVATYLFEPQGRGQTFSVLTFVGVILAMAYIWLGRQAIQGEPQLSLKNALYAGPMQIVPLLLLVILLGLQLLPFSIGGFIFQTAVNSSPPFAVFYWEKLLFALGWLLLSIPTLYWILPTLFGLIVVCIPGVKPLEARRAAYALVTGRMFSVWLALLLLIFVDLLVIGGVVFGLINLLPFIALYVVQYSGVVLLPPLIYQLFAVYQALRVTDAG